jgi:hypothetical protein
MDIEQLKEAASVFQAGQETRAIYFEGDSG